MALLSGIALALVRVGVIQSNEMVEWRFEAPSFERGAADVIDADSPAYLDVDRTI